jgi:tetratricopeptide (TPR) repeat protein
MSDGVRPQWKSRLVAATVVGGLILLVSAGYYILHNPYGPPKVDPAKANRREENFLAQARTALAKQTDLATCRTAIQLLNAHLQKATEQPPALTPAAATRLRDQLALSAEEAAEVASTSLTPLDGHHLDSCFLFRDAARSLEMPPLSGAGGKAAKVLPLHYAVAGFDWVMRQVRLSDISDTQAGEQAPPAAILRRGVGSALQRSLVFLALLEQFSLDDADTSGLQGCLVYCPDGKGVRRRLWACGVAIGTKPESLYLFDPRVGLAIPGPGGKGVATLAQARSDPSVLAQWKFDKLSYDVTADQAKDASALVVVPLSAAAPRMRFLQDRLLRDRTLNEQALPAQIRVRLAEDPKVALSVVRAAFGNVDKVSIWREGTGILRRFIPTAEGGADQAAAKGLLTPLIRFGLNTMPQGDYPAILNRADKLGNELEQRLRLAYALPFLRALVDPNSPRDLELRGRFAPAVRDLVQELDDLQKSQRRLRQSSNLGPEVRQWIEEKAIPAYADSSRSRGTPDEAAASARAEQLWRWKLGEPIEVLINGSLAGPRGAEVTYQIALIKFEQATRFRQRVDLASTIGLTLQSDADNARENYLDAEGYWKEFLDNNPTRPGVASAQFLRAESLAHLGRKDEATKRWKDTSAPQTDLERLGRLWKAR